MTLVTFTVAHWYAQKMRRYPQWDNYAHDYINAHAPAHDYDYAHVYTNVGRCNLTCANRGPQRGHR
jgi:hypothetical protein